MSRLLKYQPEIYML